MQSNSSQPISIFDPIRDQAKKSDGLKKQSLWVDLGICCSLALLGCLSTYALVSDYSFVSIDSEFIGQEIALIEMVENNVQYKNAAIPFWINAEDRQTVRSGDKIFTDNNSSARLEFEGLGTLIITENSLIELETSAQGSMINLVSGSISSSQLDSENPDIPKNTASKTSTYPSLASKNRFKNGVSHPPIFIKTGNSKITLDHKADFDLKTSEKGDVSISVKKGKVDLVNLSSLQNTTIQTNKRAQLNFKGKVKSITSTPIILNSPPSGKTLYKKGEKLQFSWKAHEKIKVYTLQVAEDINFKKISGEYNTTIPVLSIAPDFDSRSKLYWRVSNQSGNIVSSARSINFVQKDSIELIYPLHASRVDAVTPSTHSQQFIWRTSSNQSDRNSNSWVEQKYTLEISKSSSFKNPIITEQTSRQSVSVPMAEMGNYYWRVVARFVPKQDRRKTVVSISPTGFFQIKASTRNLRKTAQAGSSKPRIIEFKEFDESVPLKMPSSKIAIKPPKTLALASANTAMTAKPLIKFDDKIEALTTRSLKLSTPITEPIESGVDAQQGYLNKESQKDGTPISAPEEKFTGGVNKQTGEKEIVAASNPNQRSQSLDSDWIGVENGQNASNSKKVMGNDTTPIQQPTDASTQLGNFQSGKQTGINARAISSDMSDTLTNSADIPGSSRQIDNWSSDTPDIAGKQNQNSPKTDSGEIKLAALEPQSKTVLPRVAPPGKLSHEISSKPQIDLGME